jgi:hypothetical protein
MPSIGMAFRQESENHAQGAENLHVGFREPETGRREKQCKKNKRLNVVFVFVRTFWPGLGSLAFWHFRRAFGSSGMGFGGFQGFGELLKYLCF